MLLLKGGSEGEMVKETNRERSNEEIYFGAHTGINTISGAETQARWGSWEDLIDICSMHPVCAALCSLLSPEKQREFHTGRGKSDENLKT